MNLNVLQKATKTQLIMDPFPHLIIENALPQEVYNKLGALQKALDLAENI